MGKTGEGFARVDQRPGPIGTYGVLVVVGQDVTIDERNMESKAEKINAAYAERVKPLVEALERIGSLSQSNDRHLDDYGAIARKALEAFRV